MEFSILCPARILVVVLLIARTDIDATPQKKLRSRVVRS